MASKVSQSWEDFLNPDVIRPRLIAASVFISGFELLKDSIIGRISDFLADGFDRSGPILGSRYKAEVLSRNKSPVYASLSWLRERDVVDDHDLAAFERAKACRNTLAHRLFSALGVEGLPPDFGQCFNDMLAVLRKIEVWWIANVEIPTDPDYDGEEINENRIAPGPVMAMRLLVDIALGDEEQSRSYYDAFRKHAQGGN